jgi:hypothetical protein
MNEMQDKEFDDLFRKSLADPDIPFDPDAWKAMESKLDAQDRRRGFYLRVYAAGIVSVLLLAGAVFFLQKEKSTDPVAQASSSIVQPDQTSSASSGNTGTEQSSASAATNFKDNTANSTNTDPAYNKGLSQKTDDSEEPSARSGQEALTAVERVASTSKTSTTESGFVKRGAAKNTEENNTAIYTTDKNNKVQKRTAKQGALYTDNNNSYTRTEKTSFGTVAKSQQDTVVRQTALGTVTDSEEKAGTEHANNVAGRNSALDKSIIAGTIGTEAGIQETSLSTNNKTGEGLGNTTNTNPANADIHTPATTNGSTDIANANTGTSLLRDTAQVRTGADENSGMQNTGTNESNLLNIPGTEVIAIAALDSIPVKTDSLTRVDTTSIKDKDKKEPYKRGFSISLLLNPEYNSPTDFSFYKPGFNIGFNAEYYILPRLSIVSGMIYGKKLYACDASDYGSSPSYIRYGKAYYPEQVKASCGVIDIPVNIRYKFLNKKSFNLYATTGLSSYIMLKETYIFQYSGKSNRPDEEEDVVNKNRYLFNIWNVSLGIEKRINDTWSVQAEPYIKLPLNGIGAGDIKLVSTGVYFSLKYYFK